LLFSPVNTVFRTRIGNLVLFPAVIDIDIEVGGYLGNYAIFNKNRVNFEWIKVWLVYAYK
jgi:hypothetical protein